MRDSGPPGQQQMMQGSTMMYLNSVRKDEEIDLNSDDETPDNVVRKAL